MNFEKQLEAIKNKAELHAWIDSLPDDVEGLILVHLPESDRDRDWYKYREIGDITIERSNYMIDGYKHFLLQVER